ncbi:F0F1 ATP synthase subunit B [Flavobacteriaceae bacterium]|jgi:F-type H+-transporting ATPase subunit b|nr:F0F1 ATP synthase subunit B [Bacteroidota bacterium]MDA7568005.1 F0F1 ATP synthase subunit B [Flavobacteriaceae bacterium]MDA9552218.1 F0F1 ATP synthase subunit B [Flavobacteriaceae bacterium]MDB2612301.1 F0F1 ATP synthase subunit B [Flavobacteriaceae bacterium]MDC1051606.1 F0F1 ATP synthase subunit B [Flavobacteriaceae bacterium]|tara:strand:- start:109 stop:603 length:495 start_codon:yes stop_codon:yes gene_type:complete
MDLVTPDVGLLFWTVISFFVLLFLLRKFAWKPIVGTVNDRETSIREALESAEKARLEMQNLTADNERILKEARVERETMLKEAREIKAKMISDAKDEAQTQANKMIEQAQIAIASEKKSAMAELKNHVAGLSVDIAEKMVREELSNKDKQLKLVENMLGEAKLN